MEVILIVYTIYIGVLNIALAYFIYDQHKKTRKETQEIKTRLTWLRKNLQIANDKIDRIEGVK